MILGNIAGGEPIPPEVTYPTWDPANKDTDITLSNGNLDADSNEPSGGGSVLVTQTKNSGKYYFEIHQVQQYASNAGYLSGLMRGTTDVPTFIGASANSWGLASTTTGSDTWTGGSSGNNSAQGAASLSAYHKCAVDLTNGRIWFAISNRNSGAWIGGGDPALGTSPTFTYTPNATPLRIAGCPRRGAASPSTNRNKLRLHADPSTWSGTAPSGFGAWSETAGTTETIEAVYTTPTPNGTDSALPSGVLNAIGGDLDIEWTGIARWDLQENSSAFTAWSLDGGNQRLSYSGGENGTWTLRVNSTNILTASMIDTSAAAGQRAADGQLIQVRAWRVGTSAGIRVLINGVMAYDATTTGVSSTAVPTPTTGYLNSVSGGSPYADIDQVLFTVYNSANASRTPTFVGCVIGDSTVASYGEASGVPTASLLRSGGVCKNEFIKSLAIGGATTAQQQTQWNAFSEKSNLRWVLIEVGLNDIDPAEAAGPAITRIQSLVNAVNSSKPAGCLVYIATMTPCYQRMITRYGAGAPADASYAKWQAMNEAIRGEGGTPITGVDGRISSHTTTMDDGSGNLAALYDSGDGIHPNNTGRQVMADAWLAALDL